MKTKKSSQKPKYSLGFIFIFILLIGVVYLNVNKKTNTNINTSNNSYLQPSYQPQNPEWINYQSGSQVNNYGFSLTSPIGWKIKTQEQGLLDNVGYRINFDLEPQDWQVENTSTEGWYGWGVMSVDVYPAKPDINQWLSTFLPEYKDYLTYDIEQIGNKPSYNIYPRLDAPEYKKEFRGRNVILGSKNSYVIGFSNNSGRDDFPQLAREKIFPNFNFE